MRKGVRKMRRKMKLFIWGAGGKGERIFKHFDTEDIIAFVDSNDDKVGREFCGKRVISVAQYLEEYSEYYIVLAHSDELQSVDILENRGITNYFRLSVCPGELQEPNSRSLLKEYIENYLNDRKDYVLYGITLYSILIDRWIYNKSGVHPLILAEEGTQGKRLDKLRANFNELAIVEWKAVEKGNISEVDAVIPDIPLHIKSELEVRFQYVDLHDCSKRITAYRNPRIEKYKNRHINERCFIVATGPSLRAEDLDILETNQEITFSVNSIFHVFEKTAWRPTYYVSDDYRAIQSNAAVIDGMVCAAKFIGDTYAPFWNSDHPENVYKFHKHYEYYYNELPKFSDDFAQRSYTGLTVTYTCIQLAVYMGFKEIYLLGADCNYVKGSNSNYFFKSSAEDFFDHQLDKTVLAYQAAKKYAEANNIKIYNATRGGKLEVFERVAFDSLFEMERKA